MAVFHTRHLEQTRACTMRVCEDCLSAQTMRASFPKGTSFASPHAASRETRVGCESKLVIAHRLRTRLSLVLSWSAYKRG